MKKFQFWTGISFIVVALWGIYDVYTRIYILEPIYSGIIIGNSTVYVMWGIREIIGSLVKPKKKVKNGKS